MKEYTKVQLQVEINKILEECGMIFWNFEDAEGENYIVIEDAYAITYEKLHELSILFNTKRISIDLNNDGCSTDPGRPKNDIYIKKYGIKINDL